MPVADQKVRRFFLRLAAHQAPVMDALLDRVAPDPEKGIEGVIRRSKSPPDLLALAACGHTYGMPGDMPCHCAGAGAGDIVGIHPWAAWPGDPVGKGRPPGPEAVQLTSPNGLPLAAACTPMGA